MVDTSCLRFLPHVRGWSEAINRCWFTKISIKYRRFYTGRLFSIVKSFPPYRWHKGRDRRQRRDVSTYRTTMWISLSLNAWNASKQVLLLIGKSNGFIPATIINFRSNVKMKKICIECCENHVSLDFDFF